MARVCSLSSSRGLVSEMAPMALGDLHLHGLRRTLIPDCVMLVTGYRGRSPWDSHFPLSSPQFPCLLGMPGLSMNTFPAFLYLNHVVHENKQISEQIPGADLGTKWACPNPASSLARYSTVPNLVYLTVKRGQQRSLPGGGGN